MARSTEDILTQMDDQQTAESGLSSLNNPSQTSIYQLFKGVVAQCINYFEQLVDTKKDETDALLVAGVPDTEAYIQAQVLKFQYSSTNPQVLSLVNYIPTYATVDEDLRIVTRCAVTTDLNKLIKIKVAKDNPPTTLSASEYASLYAYIDSIIHGGVSFDVVNLISDKLRVEAEVYYDGQYIDVIQANVEAAINDYLANLPFNGYVYITGLEDAIQAVDGVKDVKLISVKGRPNATALGSATTAYSLASGTNSLKYQAAAGYIVEETTASNTFADTITYIVD